MKFMTISLQASLKNTLICNAEVNHFQAKGVFYTTFKAEFHPFRLN